VFDEVERQMDRGRERGSKACYNATKVWYEKTVTVGPGVLWTSPGGGERWEDIYEDNLEYNEKNEFYIIIIIDYPEHRI